jgi:RNA polymerase sigma factor (sigma-70 family)
MATGLMSRVVGHLRQCALLHDDQELSDRQLLDGFATRREETAFAALVRRHGPMVLGVCRRVLRDTHDAEDAFQATFLVLVRKAATLARGELLGNWLYGVAHRTALKARATATRRRAKERQALPMPGNEALDRDTDLQELLDLELQRLPERYRVPIVLCYLEGQGKREVARQLSLPEGTISSRLARGRDLLRQRLTCRGLTLTAGALAAILSPDAASAAVPAPLVLSTARAATVFAAGKTAAAGLISVPVAALTEGVLKAMLLNKLKIATAWLLAVVFIGTGAGVYTHYAQAQKSPPAAKGAPKKSAEGEGKKDVGGVLQAVDAAKNTITVGVTFPVAKDKKPEDRTFTVDPAAEVLIDDGKVDKFAPAKQGKLGDLPSGALVMLQLSADGQKVVRIRATGPTVQGTIQAVDTTKKTLTLTTRIAKDGGAGEAKTFEAKDARIVISDGKKEKAAGTDAQLGDLKVGCQAALQLSLDQKLVLSIRAEGPSVRGLVQKVDAGKKSLTVLVQTSKDDPGSEQTYDVKDAVVYFEDAKAEKAPPKERSLGDLAEGLVVTLRLSLDQTAVQSIAVQLPTVHGAVRSVDATKRQLTVVSKNKEGSEQEQTFTVGPDAKVLAPGDDKNAVKELSLGQLRERLPVRLRLSADKQTVTGIQVEQPSSSGLVQAVDAAKHSITVEVVGKKGGGGGTVVTYTVEKDAPIVIDGKAAQLADVKQGVMITLRLSAVDGGVVGGRVEGKKSDKE